MSQISERYASALYDVTQAQGITEATMETLVALKQSLSDNGDILEILSTPLISDTEKLGVLRSAVGEAYSKPLATFFELLIKNNRLADLPTIVSAFQQKSSRDLGIETGSVRSASELSDAEKTEVKKTIEEKLNKKVDLQFVVDPNMIGGIEAKVGSFIFEDSIKTHMQKLNDFITRRVQ